jgi:peptidoglycan/LPS O-acetylase OafA/YrhL
MPDRGPRHLDAVDVVRVLTIALVIGVHTLGALPQATGVATGAFVTVFHVSREVFVVLTTLVLVHVYGRRPVGWVTFWRRRYAFVAVPYATWTLIYLIADGQHLDPVSSFVVAFGRNLVLGASRYHLYFLLVTMQIYLCFPVIRWFLHVTRRHHAIVLAGCLVYQLLFTFAVHQQGTTAGILGAWLRGPDGVLPSYLLYVVAGGVAAWHLDMLLAAIRRYRGTLLACGAASIALGVAVYLAQVAGGQAPVMASAVFQPVVVVESAGVVATFFALGVTWADHGRPAGGLVTTISDASFGIYLAHPLLLEGLVAVAIATGLRSALVGLPVAVALALALVVVVPAVYAASALLTILARRGPFSMALTGRRRQVGDAVPHGSAAPAPATARAA